MSRQTMGAVQLHSRYRKDDPANFAPFKILLALAWFAAPDGTVGEPGNCPSRRAIAERAGVHRNTVGNWLPQMVADGELEIVASGGAGRGQWTQYRILLPLDTADVPFQPETAQAIGVPFRPEMAQAMDVPILERMAQRLDDLAQQVAALRQEMAIGMAQMAQAIDVPIQQETAQAIDVPFGDETAQMAQAIDVPFQSEMAQRIGHENGTNGTSHGMCHSAGPLLDLVVVVDPDREQDLPPPPTRARARSTAANGRGARSRRPGRNGQARGAPDVLRVLDDAGIAEPKRSHLARLPHITPDYVRAHLDSATSTGQAIYRMEHAWPMPRADDAGDACPECGERLIGGDCLFCSGVLRR